MFINRIKELHALNEIYSRKSAQLLAIYGRRRIGKTSLLIHWLENYVKDNGIYWVAHRTSSKILLDSFSESVLPYFNTEAGSLLFSSWETALRQIAKFCDRKHIALILDEFPYLVEAVPSFPSMLQAIWDHYLSKSQIMLILCGSHYQMMRREIQHKNGPLFGRTTADLLIDEIEPNEMHKFLPRYSAGQLVETYSILGGVPKYLQLWDDNKPVLKNIEEILLSPVTMFQQEPIFLIQDEIAEVRTYLAILEAIGAGHTHPKDIGLKCGIALPNIGKYLAVLTDLNFVRRLVSIDSFDPAHSRMSNYEIKDRYLRFYFSNIRPHLTLLEQQRTQWIIEHIKEILPVYVARNGFEEICRREIASRGDAGKLSFNPHYIGRLWNKKAEIDVAAIDNKNKCALLGECKWTEKSIGDDILQKLISKTTLFPQLRSYKIHFVLFAKNGFTTSLVRRAKKERVLLLTNEEISCH
ncbi:MAG: ATP-binding protein [Chitinivibrionales bacterium]|nr:ATP-binding protein [Chitinivibrionales bacterium]